MSNSDQPLLRVGSYNVRAGLGTDLRRRPVRVIETIAGLGADIVALQEADFRTRDRPTALPPELIEELTGLRPLPVGLGRSLGWHGNAILARPEYAVEGIERLELPGLEPRGAVFADLGGPIPLRIVAVHLGLMRRSRRRQLEYLRHALAERPERATLILGDFNEWSQKVGLGRLAADFSIVTPHKTFPANRPIGALDRMAHCDNLLIQPRPLAKAKGTQASDHLPIVADVSLAPTEERQAQIRP